MPQLIFYVESGYPQVYNLLTRKTTIGRNEDNDIQLSDSRVSGHHAELVKKAPGSYQLNDLASDLGTAVNGKLIDEVDLKSGDQIKFGSVNAAFVDQSESDEDKLLRETVEKDLEAKSGKLAEIEGAIEARNNVLEAIPVSEGKLESLEKSLADLEQRNETERNTLQSLQNEIENCRQKNLAIQSALQTKENDLGALEKDRSGLQLEYRRVHTAYENSVRLKEELDVQLAKLRKDTEKQKAALEEKAGAYEEAKAVIEEATSIQARMDELDAGLESREISYGELGEKIAERETALEKLDEKIARRNESLEELNQSLESRHKAAEELSRVICENNEQIKSSRGMLESMESTLQKEIDEISRSQETQESLSRESLSLSSLINGKTAILQRLNEKFDAAKNGSKEVAVCPPLRVINPAMRSLVHYFQHGAGAPDQDRVNPIGYYGLAACTRGSMHREGETIPAGDDPVLVLLQGEMDKDKALIEALTWEMSNRILLVCWPGGKLDALAAEQEIAPESLQLSVFLEGVSGVVSVDSRTAELIDELKVGRPHLKIPLPCPVELPDWNAPVPDGKRSRGVFVSVNDFDPDSRIHRGRLNLLNQLVAETKTTVTLYHTDPVEEIEGLAIPDQLITKPDTPMKYSECLALMREHHFVMGLGKNPDGGDVLGDALLSRTVFLGADFNNVIDQLLFPDSSVKGDDIKRAVKKAARMLSDESAFNETVGQAQSLAPELISFESVNERLSEFFKEVSEKPAKVGSEHRLPTPLVDQ